MPVLSNAANIKVGAQQAAKVMLGGAMVWEFSSWEPPADPAYDYREPLVLTPNETMLACHATPMLAPTGPYLEGTT